MGVRTSGEPTGPGSRLGCSPKPALSACSFVQETPTDVEESHTCNPVALPHPDSDLGVQGGVPALQVSGSQPPVSGGCGAEVVGSLCSFCRRQWRFAYSFHVPSFAPFLWELFVGRFQNWGVGRKTYLIHPRFCPPVSGRDITCGGSQHPLSTSEQRLQAPGTMPPVMPRL